MKRCLIEYCSYPDGECAGLCSSKEEKRQDIIGQNGNDGLVYEAAMKFETRIETMILQISHGSANAYRAVQRNNIFEVEQELRELQVVIASALALVETEKACKAMKI